MIRLQLEQGSPEWLQFRLKGIGASDIPAIIGCKGAYKSRNALIKEKLHGAEKISSYTQKIFDHGHAWEGVVREYLEKQDKKFTPAVVQHPIYPEFFSSLDGVDDQETLIIEVKSTSKTDLFNQCLDGRVPENFYYQIQWQFYCTSIEEAWLMVVNNGNLVRVVVRPEIEAMKFIESHAFKFLSDLRQIGQYQQTQRKGEIA